LAFDMTTAFHMVSHVLGSQLGCFGRSSLDGLEIPPMNPLSSHCDADPKPLSRFVPDHVPVPRGSPCRNILHLLEAVSKPKVLSSVVHRIAVLVIHLSRVMSTRTKYQEIVSKALRQDEDVVAWINASLHAQTPIGTVLPARAAVKHYLMAEEGYGEEELEQLLPKAKGRRTKFRGALTPDQLALYHAAVDQVDREPARTILSLLPRIGLGVGELCSLQVIDVGRIECRMIGSAATLLDEYIERFKPEEWVFVGYQRQPIGTHAIRKYTRKIAEENQELHGLSPICLRHTFAVMALRNGMSLKKLQEILGHSSIKTTERYLHPTRTDPPGTMKQLGD